MVAAVPIFFFFNDTATTEIYTLSLHDALPICARCASRCLATRSWRRRSIRGPASPARPFSLRRTLTWTRRRLHGLRRSEEHTSELQSLAYLVCRLLLEKKKLRSKSSPR